MRHTENAVSLSAVPSEARSKRRTQNACSGTRVLNARVVYSSFWLQKPPNPFFAPCKKDPLCHIEFFNNFSKSSWDLTVNSTTIKFVEGQNLFLSERKRIREGNLTCPTILVRPEPFLLQPKKDPELGRSTLLWLPPFWARKSSQIPYLGEKGFSVRHCPGPGNTLALDSFGKKDPLFKTRVPESPQSKTPQLLELVPLVRYIRHKSS